MTLPARKPDWLRVRLPAGEQQDKFKTLKETFRSLRLHTVCEEARCPNIFECWGEGTATIMILGDVCTRGCRFCSVTTGKPGGVVDAAEPENTARALAQLDLSYVVLTMVDRDDLSDGGAAHVTETVGRIKAYSPGLLVETLVGDFRGDENDVATIVEDGKPDVFSHNVEVVPSLQRKIRDARCSWDRSIEALRFAKQHGAEVTKSSLMVGIGEREDEVIDAMQRLRDADVNVLTVGQYLRPTRRHAPVQRYVDPEEFAVYKERGLQMGFSFVASGPLVRSSYRAAEAFMVQSIRSGAATDTSAPSRTDAGHGVPEHDGDRYGRRRLTVIT